CRGRENAVVDFGENQDAHQIASISLTAVAMTAASSETEPTVLPATRSAGGDTFSTLRRGARSTPNSSTGRTASGLERAFITMGRAALRGVLRRRSAVTMAGSGRAMVSRP